MVEKLMLATLLQVSPSNARCTQRAPVARHERALRSGALREAPAHPKPGLRLLQVDDGQTSFMLAPPHARGAYGAVSYAQDRQRTRWVAKTHYTQPSCEQRRSGVGITPMIHAVHELTVARTVPDTLESIAAVATGERLVHIMQLMDGTWAQAQSTGAMQASHATLSLEAFAQSARALASFHAFGVLHGDIKLENLLWSQDGTIKWSDYGFSKRVSPLTGKTEGLRGSPFAMAPEIVERNSYGLAADMWSFGVALGEMFVGHAASPFRLMRQPQERAYLVQESLLDAEGKLDTDSLLGGYSPMHHFLRQWYAISPETCRFGIEELLHYDPSQRATSERAVAVAEHLIEAQPAHAQSAATALANLAVPDTDREAAFARLGGAWGSVV